MKSGFLSEATHLNAIQNQTQFNISDQESIIIIELKSIILNIIQTAKHPERIVRKLSFHLKNLWKLGLGHSADQKSN